MVLLSSFTFLSYIKEELAEMASIPAAAFSAARVHTTLVYQRKKSEVNGEPSPCIPNPLGMHFFGRFSESFLRMGFFFS